MTTTVSVSKLSAALRTMKLSHVDRTAAELAGKYQHRGGEVPLDSLPESVQEQLSLNPESEADATRR